MLCFSSDHKPFASGSVDCVLLTFLLIYQGSETILSSERTVAVIARLVTQHSRSTTNTTQHRTQKAHIKTSQEGSMNARQAGRTACLIFSRILAGSCTPGNSVCILSKQAQRAIQESFLTVNSNHLSNASKRNFTSRSVSDIQPSEEQWKNYLEATDSETESILAKDMLIFPDFLREKEEESLLAEVEPYMKRLRYEFDHWDNAIHGYRETEKLRWNEENQKILQRVWDLAFPPGVPQIAYVHVLDISKEGYIKPHVDAVRFCGNTIAGMCLLSSCVMRLALEKDSSRYGDFLLNRRSLYVMKHRARYEYTHEVLPDDKSVFKGQKVPRDRRISVICRNEPDSADTE